jgi:hypothetical protein
MAVPDVRNREEREDTEGDRGGDRETDTGRQRGRGREAERRDCGGEKRGGERKTEIRQTVKKGSGERKEIFAFPKEACMAVLDVRSRENRGGRGGGIDRWRSEKRANERRRTSEGATNREEE